MNNINNIRFDDPKIPFENKKLQMERKIEEIISYFTEENNLKNPSRDLKLIVKKLVRIREKLTAKRLQEK